MAADYVAAQATSPATNFQISLKSMSGMAASPAFHIVAQFLAARFHVQDREFAFATGRRRRSSTAAAPHVADFVLAVHAGRVVFHDGDADLAPG